MPSQPILSWDAVSDSDLDHYIVYQGTAPGTYSSNNVVAAPTTIYTASVALGSRWYFAVSAMDTSGNESGLSNEVSKLMVDYPLQLFAS